MLSIEKFSYSTPKKLYNIFDDYEEIGITFHEARVYTRMYGLKYLPIIENEQELMELISNSVRQVVCNENTKDIKHIIYAHTSAITCSFSESIVRNVKYNFNLTNALHFGISFNKCTSIFSAISLAEQLLAYDTKDAKVLIITGEIAFSRDLRLVNGVTLIGDAASAILVKNDGDRNKVISLTQNTFGKFAKGVWINEEDNNKFQTSISENFHNTIKQALSNANLELSNIKCILPHNVNIPVWLSFAKKLNIDIDKIYLDMVSQTGHCFCSDLVINYINAKNAYKFTSGDYILVASLGVGATFATMIIKC